MDHPVYDGLADPQRAEVGISASIDPTTATEKRAMNLEQTLEKIVEHAHEELRIVRKRAEQKTAARGTARITTKLKPLPIDWTTTHT